MITIESEEFMASLSTLAHIHWRWPDNPDSFCKMRPGRIPFAIRIISMEKVSSFKQTPDLLFLTLVSDTDSKQVKHTITPTFHTSIG